MACQRKVVLVSIDGQGIAPASKGNAISIAKTPVMDKLKDNKKCYTELNASGLHVGLPKGVMGNSEVGHLTMGSGRTKFTDLVKINLAIENGSFSTNSVLQNAFNYSINNSKRLHLLGLVSDGGVHSHIDHLFEFVKAAKQKGIPNLYIHFFADGRDTPPNSGHTYVKRVVDFLNQQEYGSLASIVGRYYAMDRDKRQDRITIAYDMLVKGQGQCATKSNIIDEIKRNYEEGIFDEFLKPIILDKSGCIQDNDTLIFIDFRSDRMRQIVETFGIKPPFDTDVIRKNLHVVQMTEYNASFGLPILYPPQTMKNVLSEYIADKGLSQFHCAETEKYAHVTFFFNGGREIQFKNEDRVMVPSPKVATYDLLPSMSMPEVTDEIIKAMSSGKYSFIMCNLAPPDMVGHTGNLSATIKACEATDECIGKLVEFSKHYNFTILITSDHGNAEEMLDEKGEPKTSHNSNLVPLCMVDSDNNLELCQDIGSLSDVAPTILSLMGFDSPSEMSGKSLIKIK